MDTALGKEELSAAEIGPHGAVDFCVYLSNACDRDIDKSMHDWLFKHGEETTITIKFTAAELVDASVMSHELCGGCGVVDIAAKPLFMAMRADFENAIKTINALMFA